MRWRLIFQFFMMLGLFAFVIGARSQGEVYAEAFGQANLRAHDYIEAAKVGEIVAGQRYPVLGRSARYPWLLLGDAQTGAPLGWVYRELVRVEGDLANVPYSEHIVREPAAISPDQTSTPTSRTAVNGTARGEINLRAGPGVGYPRLGVARAGERYEILATHAQYPWLRIASPDLPDGSAWVAEGLLDIEGNLATLPRETPLTYATPALTATPVVVRAPAEAPPLSPAMKALGENIWSLFLAAGFDFLTEPVGALYLYDLRRGAALQFGEQIAFSGTSLTKIAILIELYRQLDFPPSQELALLVANTMICSDNRATNELLRIVGRGDELAGALQVTATMRTLGLTKSFMSAPYAIPGEVTIPIPALPIDTIADQERNQPDPYNQATVDELGQLLRGMYDCARDETGILNDAFPGKIRASECRSMLHVMGANHVDSLLKSGVPAGITVAHKHGWVADTHGNAALFFTPGGDYALVMLLYKPQRLDFLSESLPLFAEVSRVVYNAFNPVALLAEARPGYIPPLSECDFVASPLLWDIQAANSGFPP